MNRIGDKVWFKPAGYDQWELGILRMWGQDYGPENHPVGVIEDIHGDCHSVYAERVSFAPKPIHSPTNAESGTVRHPSEQAFEELPQLFRVLFAQNDIRPSRQAVDVAQSALEDAISSVRKRFVV
jgi:hypothetical protein